MNLLDLKFQHRGKTVEGQIGVPENLSEAVMALGEQEVWECFIDGYVKLQQKRLTHRRRKRVVVRIDDLTEEQKRALKNVGLFKE